VQYEDILPTMIDVAGGAKIDSLDGISQLPVLLGMKKEIRKWAYGMHNNHPEGLTYSSRSIQDKQYKLIINFTYRDPYVNTKMMKPTDRMWTSWQETIKTDEHAAWLMNKYIQRPEIEFYDKKNDPWELTNLAEEPKYATRIATMKDELQRWMQSQGDPGESQDILD